MLTTEKLPKDYKGVRIMVNISEIYPNEAERVMFLRGLIRLAKADGVLEPEEVVFFDAAVQGLGVSVTVGAELRQILLDDIFTSPYLEMQFAKPAQGLFFVREAMLLCYADGEYSEEEQLEILSIATELNIPLKKIEEIESWVKAGVVWREAGDQLLEL